MMMVVMVLLLLMMMMMMVMIDTIDRNHRIVNAATLVAFLVVYPPPSLRTS